MYAQHRRAPAPRFNSFHNVKQKVLGNQAGNVPPAWRFNNSGPAVRRQQVVGSKILLSHLPLDVGEKEVEELFKKTVGPLKDSFLIYNSQGRSKGMAVVEFHRAGDAMVARSKYDGKFVDGRRPIRIETAALDRSLLLLLLLLPHRTRAPIQNHKLPRQVAAAASIAKATVISLNVPQDANAQTRRRVKKGPKRLKKQNVQFPKFATSTTKTREQLDQEMEEYRASGSDAL
ncbi:hypothetical protein BT96DRAFT_916461 [Gymnopus androsaceus JB14]|uniref:RRM domain-containing protein n=1 Tax=Gymnopus androsaceus JB14 TaxID=1447944 RepID=A0A6A4I004_9AGAR|nr:hypothetical protein BT96DRAFT_916461 [Gymnopus androsaceus JB14]